MKNSQHEARQVAEWLRRTASETTPSRPLPTASQLWWRAQIIRDLTEQESLVERIVRPARWTQWACLGLLGFLAALLLSWQTSFLLTGLQASAVLAWTPSSGLRWLVGILAVGTVLPLAGLTTLWLLWRET